MGANLPQPLALIQLTQEGKRQLAKDAAALQNAFTVFLESVNAKLDRHERLKQLVLVTDEWSIESGLLTPTLKIKRYALEAHYATKIEAWSGERAPIVLGCQ
jgi:long-subunit acyl-CoA synthetase (AMP-forming)